MVQSKAVSKLNLSEPWGAAPNKMIKQREYERSSTDALTVIFKVFGCDCDGIKTPQL